MAKNLESNRKPFTPEDIRRIKIITDPMVHPDGNRVAYVLRTVDPDPEKNRYRAEIHLTDSKGSFDKILTAQDVNSEAPQWSPDGRYLLFLSLRPSDNKRQIYLMPADGGEAHRLTRLKNGVDSALWSPDSKQVSFVSGVDPFSNEGKTSYASDVVVTEQVLWREDGKGSLFRKRQHLFVVSIEGGEPLQLTSGHFDIRRYLYSRNGQLLYFLATPDPEDDWASALRADIFSISPDGSALRQVTDFNGLFTALNVLPDAHLLAVGSDYKYLEASPNRLWRVEPENGACTPVTPDLDLSIGDSIFCDIRFPSRSLDPWVSEDGQRARCIITAGSALRLAEFDLSMGSHRWLTPPDISVTGWHSSPNGRLRAEIRTSATNMPELWTVADEEEPCQITDWNKNLTNSRQIWIPRPIPFTATDGVEIDAWVMLPSLPENGLLPSILAIHGGPKRGIYGQAFMLEFQMLVGAGMAVLYCNPRGSDGYGTNFARAVFGRRDDRDVLDLMEFVDHALSLTINLDPERMGINGGGFGGYLSNWIITQTNRFKAAVSQRSISDWTSLYGASPIGYHMAPQHLGCLPWEDPDHYHAKSPLTHAAAVHTPLLLIHGDQDLRCTIEQANQFFATLKRLGRTVKLALFPGEGHGMTRTGSPNHRIDNLRLILEWFKQWL